MAKAREAEVAAIIIPITTLSNLYFQEHAPDHVFFPARRLAFLPPIGFVGQSSNPIPTAIILYGATAAELHRLGERGKLFRAGR